MGEVAMSMSGRDLNWKRWIEAAVLGSKFRAGEGDCFQSLLDNIGESGHDLADHAWDALATFAIKSPNPGGLTMTMLGLAADGVSYYDLAATVLAANGDRRTLALALTERKPAPAVYEKPVPSTRFAVSADRDWKSKLLAAPDFVGNAVAEMQQRVWRSSDRRPVTPY